MELHGERDVSTAVPEEGSGDFSAKGRSHGELRWNREPLACWDHCWEREDVQERAYE